MLPKFGLVSIGVHDEVLNWVAKHKPVSFLLVNERGQASPEKPWTNNEIDLIRNAMGQSPKTLFIFRSWPDGIGEESSLSVRVHTCLRPFRDMPNPLMGHSYNEPGFPWIGSSGDARKLAQMEHGFADVMHTHGFLSMNFCLSESHILKGNLPLWEIYAEALPYCDALGFNEYDRPDNPQGTWGELWREHDFLYRLGHWEENVRWIKKYTDQVPPVIIGENIIDAFCAGGSKGGWLKYGWPPKRYVALHQAVYDASYHKKGLFSHHTFCYPQPYDWPTFSVKPILPQLGQLIQGQVYWEPKEKPMDIWKNVPQQIAQWRSLIERCTREYPVPIPDYNGIHVSPAKVITCIIRIESNGDPKAVGGAGHAHGLMQVWKDHYPGLNLFDPEVNIRTGLQILKAKLNISKDLHEALYYYSGGTEWATIGTYNQTYWEPFVGYYKQFWGTDLEPKSYDPIQEAMADIESAQATFKAAYEAGMNKLDEAKEGLLECEK